MNPTELAAATAWATAAGAAADDVLKGWRAGRLAEVPIGPRWDVVRVTDGLGFAALTRLQEAGAPIGPVLETRPFAALEIVVPSGTATSWPTPLRFTTCVRRGLLRCPAPDATIATGRGAGGRSWVIPPIALLLPLTAAPAPWTDGDALCEAVVAATGHSVSPYLPGMRRPARARR